MAFLNGVWISVAFFVGLTSSAEANLSDLNGNLTKITWAHAVNDKEYLKKTLESDVMFIEADIVMGHLYSDQSGPAIPIMCHPPENVSDLSFEEFLSSINKFNEENKDSQKGVKLDFKSIEAYEATHDLLLPYNDPKITYPIWMNADILPGPVNSPAVPVDADRFLKMSLSFPRSVLSIGWTTNFGGEITKGEYTAEHIDEMLKAIKDNNVTHTVTFAVRAAIAATSYDQMVRLLDETKHLNPTLTVWSSSSGDTEFIDYELLRSLIVNVGVDKVYLDVLEEVERKINLPS